MYRTATCFFEYKLGSGVFPCRRSSLLEHTLCRPQAANSQPQSITALLDTDQYSQSFAEWSTTHPAPVPQLGAATLEHLSSRAIISMGITDGECTYVANAARQPATKRNSSLKERYVLSNIIDSHSASSKKALAYLGRKLRQGKAQLAQP